MERESYMSKYAHVIFDLDGTLFFLPVDWKSVRKELRDIGVTLSENVPLFPQLEILQDKSMLEKAFSIIDRYELEALENARELDDSIRMLGVVSSSMKVSLVTMQGFKFCNSLLSSRGISKFFNSIITREFSLSRRIQLERAVTLVGENKERTLFVGDRENDVLAARDTGIDVAVIGNYRGDSRPNYILREPYEVVKILEVL
jgi:phosphoglycolate phosphatase-like HAD superfamily hydrolase